MTRTNSFRALSLAAVLALGAPFSAFAAPANTGGAAEASEFVAAAVVPVTRGTVNVAENTGNAAQADGNALAVQVPVSQMAAGGAGTRAGNGASAGDEPGFGAQG
jgi:hypothetical protein